ncbi:MAG TPA: histidine kinase, partial [Chitinophagaceae bacterium]|nr:histidine kinase [Chitinophagaceae bacterium]
INHLNLSVDTIRCPKMKPDKSIVIKEASVWYDDKRDYVYQTRGEGIAQYNLVTKKMRVIPYESLFGNLPPNEGVCAPTLDGAGRICLMIPKYGIRIIDPESLCCTDSIQYGAKGLMRGDYTAAIGGNKNYFLLRSQNGIVIYDFVKQQSFLFDQSNGLSSPDNKVFLYCNGYLIVSQAGQVDYCKLSNLDNYSAAITPYLNSIFFDTTTIYIRNGFEKNRTIKLAHNQNTLSFSFSASEFVFPERIEYAYQLIPVDNDWHYTNYFNRKIIYSKLSPGSYSFRLKAQIQGGNWDVDPVEYDLIIKPAWWQTKIFIISIFILVLILAIWISRWRIRNVRKQEREKGKIEKQILELEAKALRAQMNPHFIFNCLNSIKSLIQQHEEEKSVIYLTTFSKLIRTLFNNADKKEISLYDEIETCKLYLQLEAMRFDSKFSYTVNVDENIDLKAIQIPALIVQPFIENAIWHGIVPSNNGGHISLDVGKQDSIVEIIVDDNGIGRETSLQNKSASNIAHQSKGVNLTQSRLELNNLLQQRQAKLETIDKKDEHGAPIGTMVIIKIKEELS